MAHFRLRYLIILLIFLRSEYTAQKLNIEESASRGYIITITDFNYEYEDKTSGNFIIRDYHKFTDPSEAGKYKLPYRDYVIALPPYDSCSIKIIEKEEGIYDGIIPALNPALKFSIDSVFSYEPATDYSNPAFLTGKKIIDDQKYFVYRDLFCLKFRINSHQYDPVKNQLRFLKRIKLLLEHQRPITGTVKYKPENKNAGGADLDNTFFNSENVSRIKTFENHSAKDSSDNWIDFSLKYLKLSAGMNNIYRIRRQDIAEHDESGNIVDPGTFQLFKFGKEVPIYVKGSGDGRFDEDDYIEYYGGLNYPAISHRVINNDNEEYNEYLNRYTDSSYYFLTWGKTAGKRIPVQMANLSSADTLDYYKQVSHTEENLMLQNLNGDELANQHPDWNKNKTWYWEWLFRGTKTLGITLDGILPNMQARIFAKFVSGGSNKSDDSHRLLLKMNDIMIDSQTVDRYKQVLLNGVINSNLLHNGENRITITNMENGTSPNFLGFDWYEVECPKELSAKNDSLSFVLDEKLAEKIRTVRIKNVTSPDIVLYKVHPVYEKIESFIMEDDQLIFTDTTRGGDGYILIPAGKVQTPKVRSYKRFQNLRNTELSADYIALTHDIFISQVRQYAEEISGLYGIKSVVINVNDVYDEFTYGYPYPEAVRSFIECTFQYWRMPKPVYLTIFGDANYDYKKHRFRNYGVKGGENYLPSYGFPVSDNWFAMNDALALPQLVIGRIPINGADELNYYLSKVKNNAAGHFNGWNKKYLFFSGGNASNISEISSFKSRFDSLIDQYVLPAPVGGEFHHFYKTVSPQSDYGPFTYKQLSKAIDDGAVVISYLGHSGTATWDNGINDLSQLKNNVNRNPLIIDFGCSTNKFAEPDIISFGERFLLHPEGQALGYIGNSSLGFFSSSLAAPSELYSVMAKNPSIPVGQLLWQTKKGLISTFGNNAVNKLFVMTSTLLGDPAVRLRFPAKPNLYLDENSFILSNSYFDESLDSIEIKYVIRNLGRADSSVYIAKFTQRSRGSTLRFASVGRSLPLFRDTLSFFIPVKGKPGEHELTLELDTEGEIDEIYENDNILVSKVNIYSSSINDLFPYDDQNTAADVIMLINPVSLTPSDSKIILQISDKNEFTNPPEIISEAGEFFTEVPIKNLRAGKRYWFRFKLDESNSVFSKVKSFYLSNSSKFLLNDEYSFGGEEYLRTGYHSNRLHLNNDTIKISVTSAGAYSGSTCVIAKEGRNLLTNSYFAGIGLAVMDESSLEVEYSNWYQLFNNASAMKELAEKINSIPEGKIVAMGVSDDAANNISPDLKNAIRLLGSTKIDSLKFQGSWALIGKKRSIPEEIAEMVKGPYEGIVTINKIYIAENDAGKLITQRIGPAGSWSNIIFDSEIPLNSDFKVYPIGICINGSADTLSYLHVEKNSANLGEIDAEKYPYLKIVTEIKKADPSSLTIKSIGVNYTGVPELGLNRQVVRVVKDTVEQGDDIELLFDIYNIGESRAQNLRVTVELAKKEGPRDRILDYMIDSLGVKQKRRINLKYNTAGISGLNFLEIRVDPEDQILEMHEENNYYHMPVYIIPNNKSASLRVTFDGAEIYDGDYVSSNPDIKIELTDESNMPVKDTSAVSLFLNNKSVYFADNPDLSYYFSGNNPKLSVNYKPSLEAGSYSLRILGKNATGQLIDSAGLVRRFVVEKELKILNVVNYPNPFGIETYFTFKITRIPDELRIKIFTLTGRMIKELSVPISELRTDFNKIYWDGRDRDGDPVANGVYLYMIIAGNGGETKRTIQKLSIMR